MLLDRSRLALGVTCVYCELGHLVGGSRLETLAIDFSYTTLVTELCKTGGRRNCYECVGYFVWTRFHILVLPIDFLNPVGNLLFHGDKFFITCILLCSLNKPYETVEGRNCNLKVFVLTVQHVYFPLHYLPSLL